MAYQYPNQAGPTQPAGFHGTPSGALLPDPNAYPPPPPPDQAAPPPPDGMVVFQDGSVGPDPTKAPGGPTAQPPVAGATPTTAAAAALGFPQSAFSLALQQRMAGGGVGDAMDFYNFVKNRGVMPTPDASAPAAPPVQPQPRPIVMSATNTSPAQIIPQQAPQGVVPQGPQAMPEQPNVPNAAQVPVRQPIAPGQIPGGTPANPQMPGFFPQRMAGR